MKYPDLLSSFEQISPSDRQKEEMLVKIKQKNLDERTPKKKKNRSFRLVLACASFVFVFGVGIFLFWLVDGSSLNQMVKFVSLSEKNSGAGELAAPGAEGDVASLSPDGEEHVYESQSFAEHFAIEEADIITKIHIQIEDEKSEKSTAFVFITEEKQIQKFFSFIKDIEGIVDFSRKEMEVENPISSSEIVILSLELNDGETIALQYFEKIKFLDCYPLTEELIQIIESWKMEVKK